MSESRATNFGRKGPSWHSFTQVEDAMAALRRGEFVVLAESGASSSGILVVASELTTTDHVAFMIRWGSGIVSVPLLQGRLNELDLPLMVANPSARSRTAFTVSVDARDGVSTGISASDRWRSIRALIDEETKPDDLVRPGHIYPQRYEHGGVLKRAGYTEAAMDLVKEAGLYPSVVLTHLIDDRGGLLAHSDLADFAKRFEIAFCRVADVIAYRKSKGTLIERALSRVQGCWTRVLDLSRESP